MSSLLKYYYFNKNISSFSLSSRSLSPSLSSHFFLFSSFSLIPTFSFSLSFVSIATTLKATVAVGHGSLLTGFHQLSLYKLKPLSLNQGSLCQSLSMVVTLCWWLGHGSGGMRVVGCGVVGCGFCGMGFCWVVGWFDGCGAVVEWSRAMVAYGLWVVGKGSTLTVHGVLLGTAASVSSFTLRFSLFSISLTSILSLRLGFGFGLIWRGI